MRRRRTGKNPKRRKRLLWILAALLVLLAVLTLLWTQRQVPAPLTREDVLRDPPSYAGEPSLILNGDRPFFTGEEQKNTRGIQLSERDSLGRCGPAMALLGPETRATEPRASLAGIRPSGWHTVRYDDRIEDRYLYNRCHLLGFQLSGVNADPRNLITGTRWLNVQGMLPLEILVGDYIERSGGHVLYRVTPVFRGEDLLASGVLLEALSAEDGGKALSLCRYVFNVQPGVLIDYRDGASRPDPPWTGDSGVNGEA